MYDQYRTTWYFVENRPPLTMLLRGHSIENVQRMAESESYQRGIFRRVGLARRSRSEFEYLDTFPAVHHVDVDDPTQEIRAIELLGA